MEKDLPFSASPLKCPQQPALNQAAARSEALFQVLRVGALAPRHLGHPLLAQAQVRQEHSWVSGLGADSPAAC